MKSTICSRIAKRADSWYESGERSGAWLKFRLNKGQELVIRGYRVGKNDFDNVAVGYYDCEGRRIFIAKIKNGFTLDVKSRHSSACTRWKQRHARPIICPNLKRPDVAKPSRPRR
jgi:ATP-dependent DNA ligase